jgi:cytochrome c oxidase subunit IV
MREKEAEHSNHIAPLRVYLTVAAILLILTGLTVKISLINLGGWNLVVALIIATIKATLVALFFMHLLYDKKIYWIIFAIAVVFLAVFISLTMFDTLERGAINQIQARPIKEAAKIYPPVSADSAIHHDSGGH